MTVQVLSRARRGLKGVELAKCPELPKRLKLYGSAFTPQCQQKGPAWIDMDNWLIQSHFYLSC